MGRDVVKDFDAEGGSGFQDFIDGSFADVDSITQSGKNTIVDFGNGDVFTLRNVKADDIDASDFI